MMVAVRDPPSSQTREQCRVLRKSGIHKGESSKVVKTQALGSRRSLFRFAVNRQFGMPFDERGSILGQALPGGGHFEQLVPLLWPVMSFASAWHSSA